MVRNNTNQLHNRIQPIRISLGINFRLNKQFLMLWEIFVQKHFFFRCKTEKVSMSIEFSIFELV